MEPNEILKLNTEIDELTKVVNRKEAEREVLLKQAKEREQYLRDKGFDVDNLDTTIENLSMEIVAEVKEVKERLTVLGVLS